MTAIWPKLQPMSRVDVSHVSYRFKRVERVVDGIWKITIWSYLSIFHVRNFVSSTFCCIDIIIFT